MNSSFEFNKVRCCYKSLTELTFNIEPKPNTILFLLINIIIDLVLLLVSGYMLKGRKIWKDFKLQLLNYQKNLTLTDFSWSLRLTLVFLCQHTCIVVLDLWCICFSGTWPLISGVSPSTFSEEPLKKSLETFGYAELDTKLIYSNSSAWKYNMFISTIKDFKNI